MNVRPKGLPEGRDCCNPWQKVMERIHAITEELSTTTKKIKVNGVTYTPVNEGVITLPDYPEPPEPITIDTQLDENSTNAVQNKAIAIEVNSLDGRVETTEDSIVSLEGLTQEQGEYITDLQGDVNDIETDIEENVKPDIEDLQTDLGTLSGSVEDVIEDVDDLQSDMGDLNTLLSETIAPAIYDLNVAITDLDTDKQDKLTAGTNITIDANNVISASGSTPIITETTGFTTVAAGLQTVGTTLYAISSTSQGVDFYVGFGTEFYEAFIDGKIGFNLGTFLKIEVLEEFTLSANCRIQTWGTIRYGGSTNINGCVVSVFNRDLSVAERGANLIVNVPGQTEERLSALETGKQDKLTAGTNITIDENNVISASGGGGGGMKSFTLTYASNVYTLTDDETGDTYDKSTWYDMLVDLYDNHIPSRVTFQDYVGYNPIIFKDNFNREWIQYTSARQTGVNNVLFYEQKIQFSDGVTPSVSQLSVPMDLGLQKRNEYWSYTSGQTIAADTVVGRIYNLSSTAIHYLIGVHAGLYAALIDGDVIVTRSGSTLQFKTVNEVTLPSESSGKYWMLSDYGSIFNNGGVSVSVINMDATNEESMAITIAGQTEERLDTLDAMVASLDSSKQNALSTGRGITISNNSIKISDPKKFTINDLQNLGNAAVGDTVTLNDIISSNRTMMFIGKVVTKTQLTAKILTIDGAGIVVSGGSMSPVSTVKITIALNGNLSSVKFRQPGASGEVTVSDITELTGHVGY